MKYALLSVSDKTNIVTFAALLVENGYTILSTGGTKKVLDEANIPTVAVESLTGFSSLFEGRVKTLHPIIHGGILAKRDDEKHIKEMEEHGIVPIDMVVVNLYPFIETIQKDGITLDEAIEQIDIGGPTMLRSAAKNYQYVTVVSNVNDYPLVIEALEEEGTTSLSLRKQLAQKVFAHTQMYDAAIADYLSDADMPKRISLQYHLMDPLRYGENPHQTAAIYAPYAGSFWLKEANQLQGKKLSYNNVQDATSALLLLREFTETTCVALKHTNPCAVASRNSSLDAYKAVYESDPVSIFGGIVAFNDVVTEELAKELNHIFVEILIAPKFTPEAIEILGIKPNVRVLEFDAKSWVPSAREIKQIDGGLLMQDRSDVTLLPADLKMVTKVKPTAEEIDELLYAYKIVKHVKSNAIVVTDHKQTVGIGAGQMNRVGAVKLAVDEAKKLGKTPTYLASDAFFPFADSVKACHKAGVKFIIQPGGSIRDQEVIDFCNDHGIAMVFTGIREFKH